MRLADVVKDDLGKCSDSAEEHRTPGTDRSDEMPNINSQSVFHQNEDESIPGFTKPSLCQPGIGWARKFVFV